MSTSDHRRGLDPSKGLTPSWALHFYKRPRSSSARSRPSQSRDGPRLLTPKSTSSESAESRSVGSNSKARGRSSFRNMMNRLRSSSSITLVDEPGSLIQESEFKSIEDWFVGFDRYNQLVTTQISRNGSYSTEAFERITNMLTKNCGGRFIHALPEAVFDLSLLWCPAGALARKQATEEPSWSWTGWEGPVNFPFDPTNCPDLLTMSRSEGEWVRSEILQYHLGPQSAPYTVRREKERRLRIHYPPYFHAPRGYDINEDSDVLRFSAMTIPADGFIAEQLRYEGNEIPCSHLLNEKDQHCGVIMDYEEAISAPSSTGPFEFVLVSRNIRKEPATQTRRPVISTIHPPGTPIWDNNHFVWDQEVNDFDENVFEEGPWKVLNVILIKWMGNYAERVAVARIHEDAWTKRNPLKKDIILR